MSSRSPRAGEGPPSWTVLMLALGCMIAFAAAWFTHEPAHEASHRRQALTPDRLQTALLRCQALGDRALGDARCRAVWDEHRRRFLNVRPSAEPRP